MLDLAPSAAPMDLFDQLRTIADRAAKQADSLATEEATKNALVMPFINALGYNLCDPTEVAPKYTADVGIKRGSCSPMHLEHILRHA